MKFTLVLFFALCSYAVMAQKAFITGFSGMEVVNATSHAVNSNICCGDMVYATNSFDSSRIYVTHWGNNTIYYINPQTEAITDSMNVHVWDLASDNQTDKLFAVQTPNNAVYIINPVAKTYDSVTVTQPNMLEKRPGAKEIWITNDKQFSVLNYTGTPTVTSYPLTPNSTFYRDEVRFNSSGSLALITNGFENKVYKVDANTKAKVDSITMANAWGVEFSADGAKFYVTTALKNKIYTYDVNTMGLLDSVSTTRNPFTIYNNPFANEVWVVDHNQDSLTIFDRTTMQAIDSLEIDTNPYYIVFHKPGGVGIANVPDNKRSIGYYPNPVSDMVYFTTKADKAKLYDVTGKLMLECRECTELNTSSLPPSLYYLQLERNKQIVTEKMIRK